MKALSGRQPWWWAIMHAGKRVENRVWNTSYRGPILLHAAKGCTAAEYVEALRWMLSAGVLSTTVGVPSREEMQRGGIVGRARIVEVYPPGGLPEAFRTPGFDYRWHMDEQHGFLLADVEALPFVPWKGALGLFDIPDDYTVRANAAPPLRPLADEPWAAGAIGRIPQDDALVWRDDAVFGPQFYARSPADAALAASILNELEARVGLRPKAETKLRPLAGETNESR